MATQKSVSQPIAENRIEKEEEDRTSQQQQLVQELGEETLVKMYRKMVLIRLFEERTYQVYLQRKIGGFCHIYSGEEAVAVGAYECIDTDRDYSISAYREHGHALAAGMAPNAVMAELYGKATGCSRGKGGSMHLFDTDLNFMGGHAIVGAHIPLAAGLGFKIFYRQEDGVVLCFIGDGATNQGAFHEGLNLMGLYNLPVVVICENNGYGMGTSVERASAESELYKRASAYTIPGYRIDGLNVLEVYDVVNQAVEQARSQNQPTFIEAMTYRYRGHSMSDPAEYRTDEELEEYRKKDPIERFAEVLKEQDYLTEDDVDSIEEEMDERVGEALDFAEESPQPDLDDVYEDVYVSYPRDLRDKQ